MIVGMNVCKYLQGRFQKHDYQIKRISTGNNERYQAPKTYGSKASETGWMACNFTSFSTVFQSHQDNGRVAGHVGPVQTPGLFRSYPFHLGGFGPVVSAKFCWVLLAHF